jgi:drug/metabolite transporter (DMT)-like permease
MLQPPAVSSASERREIGAGVAALACAMVIWALVPLVLKLLTRSADAWTVNGLRYLFSLLFWLPVVVRHQRAAGASRRIWRDAAVPAACHLLGQIGWGLAPYHNDASVMNFVSRLSFLFAILFGFWLVADERRLARRPLFWAGAAVTATGVLAMFAGGTSSRSTSPTGLSILVWTSLCWGLYSVTVRRRMQEYSPQLGFGVVSLLVAPGLILLMFALGDWRAMFRLRPVDWLMIAGSAWVAISMGHVLYYRSVRAFGPVVSEGGMAVIPFVTALSAHAWLGERLGALQWAGGCLLVLSTVLLLGAKLRAARPITTDEPAGG